MIEVDLKLCDIVAFADPSGSKTEVKRVQARSAIAVVAGDAHDHVFVLETWAARTSTDRFVQRIFETYERWHPRVFGIEANAMQSLFADMLRREARMRGGVRIPFLNIYQPTRVEKPFRNRSALQTPINGGQLLMLKGAQIEARNELETHPMCAQFDLVDSIATSFGLLRRTSKQEAATEQQLQMATYLRKSGAPKWYIDQKLSGTKGGGPTPPRPT